MLFFDYNFKLLPDGSVRMDEELLAEKLHVEDGDKFVTEIVNNVITFRKIKENGHS